MNTPAIYEIPRPLDAVDAPPRAARFPSLVGLKRDLSAILDELDAWVIGAGSVGLSVCEHLVRQQPRSLTIVDPGVFSRENLLTQGIAPEAIGSNKASHAGLLCKRLSPRTHVRVFEGHAEDLPLGAFCSASLVLLATDNLTVEVDVAQRCLHAGVPLLQASVGGEFLVAQIRFCGNVDGSGPCIACGFGQTEWQAVSSETVYSCQGSYDAGGDGAPQPANRADTRSVSFLCNMAANLAMMQAFRHLGGLGQPVIDTLLEYSGYTHRTTISPLTRNDSCPCEHRCWVRCQLPHCAVSYTPRDLAEIAIGASGTLAGVSMTIDGLQFCEAGMCTGCGARQPIGRFIAAMRGAGRCTECGAPVDALPFCTHRPVPLAALGERFDRRLSDFVDGSPAAVVVRGTNVVVLCEHLATADQTNH